MLGRVATIVRLQLQPGVALHLELPAGPLPVVTDATMLTQILTNLLQARTPLHPASRCTLHPATSQRLHPSTPPPLHPSTPPLLHPSTPAPLPLLQNAARFTHQGFVRLLCRVEALGEEAPGGEAGGESGGDGQSEAPRSSSPATADGTALGTAVPTHPATGRAQPAAVTAVTSPRSSACTPTGSSPDSSDADGAGCSGQGRLRVAFAVEDSGSGLSEEVRETLFSLYPQAG